MKYINAIFVALIASRVVWVFATETNSPGNDAWKAFEGRAPLTVLTNGDVSFQGKLVARIDGTNWIAVPDLKALTDAQSNGFGLGVRYGAVASRRNPDVSDWTTLIGVAQQLMQADQIKQQQQQGKGPRTK